MKIKNTKNSPPKEWLLGRDQSAIERQEAQGQKELVYSCQLPVKASGIKLKKAKGQYEKMGIKVIGISTNDEIFFDVEMPNGWRKKATEHSMWSHLLDDKGRVRASIFYKASFYDRSSHIDFTRRYMVEGNYHMKNQRNYQIKDSANGDILFIGNAAIEGDLSEFYSKCDTLRKEAKLKLDSMYPNHKDINAYW